MGRDQRMNELDILARTLWGEARGEGAEGMAAVANVVMNRVARPGWWGHNVVSVCLCPCQFSCWNPSDPNRAKLEAVTEDDPAFRAALSTAAEALAGTLADRTHGATHYYARGSKAPKWAKAADKVAEIGRHDFYRALA